LKSLSFKQGRKYDDPASAKDIEPFIAFHQLDMSEVLLQTSEFKNFNEFFYRALKPDARPCSAPEDPRVIVSPADCRSVVFNNLETAQSIWVKGREFTVERLLGDAYPEDAKRYHGGSLGIFRLAPQDYHRFHIPVDGVLDEPKTIEGEYYTVNPMAIRSALDVYGENVRVICPIDSVSHGRVMVICIGAMMVGSTVITRKKGEKVQRAEELGYFKFGGSTLLVLCEPGQMKYDADLVDNSQQALETLVSTTPSKPTITTRLTLSRSALACLSATALTGHRTCPTCVRRTLPWRRNRMRNGGLRAAWRLRVSRGQCLGLVCRCGLDVKMAACSTDACNSRKGRTIDESIMGQAAAGRCSLPGRFVAIWKASWDLPLHTEYTSIHLFHLGRENRNSFHLTKHVHGGGTRGAESVRR
jgi:phosphatidylserine decarboxylase precursor